MKIKIQLHKNIQHILLGSSEKSWAYLISAPFFLIDFYLVESIVSFAKKCSTTLKWLPYRHSGHFKWSKRDFFLKENQALNLLREKKSLWVRNRHLLLKMTSFSVIKLYVLSSEKVTNLFIFYLYNLEVEIWSNATY